MNGAMEGLTSRLTAMAVSALGLTLAGWSAVAAQPQPFVSTAAVSGFSGQDEAREALERAQASAGFAQQRARQFSEAAASATAEVDRLANESAALAAQIQQSEADILVATAKLSLIADQRRALDARLAEKQQPLVKLTGAIQNMARRPVVLSAFQPGSLRETVYVRAVLETTLPTIREKTAELRSEVERGRALERDAARTLANLHSSEAALQTRRDELTALITQQQQASRSNSAMARREAQRALALAEEARDLDELVGEFDRAGSVRSALAALPGPIIRPERPDASRVMPAAVQSARSQDTSPPGEFQLPVQGRTLAGFGATDGAGMRSKGLTIAPSPGAQVVSPAAGRVSFAGPYRGFGRIVIIEHANGWTSLITGLARNSIETGDLVIAGAPIGTAGLSQPEIGYEIRERGNPVNPLNLL